MNFVGWHYLSNVTLLVWSMYSGVDRSWSMYNGVARSWSMYSVKATMSPDNSAASAFAEKECIIPGVAVTDCAVTCAILYDYRRVGCCWRCCQRSKGKHSVRVRKICYVGCLPAQCHSCGIFFEYQHSTIYGIINVCHSS